MLRRGLRFGAATLLVAARLAAAHVVPIPPSTCALDPIELEWPERHLAATVAAPDAGSVAVITYDVAGQRATVATDGTARGFTADGVAGTIRVPSFATVMVGDLDYSMGSVPVRTGDLVGGSVPVELAVGGATAAVPMTFTTGVGAAASRVVEGAPIDGVGFLVLAGAAHASDLPAPLDGPVVVRLSCRAGPRPDVDQFRNGMQSKLLRATLTANGLAFRALVAIDAATPLDFAGAAAAFRASTGAVTIAEASLPAGLKRRGHQLFIGATHGGRTRMGVRFLHHTGSTDTWELALKSRGSALPASGDARVRVELTTVLGGLLSRMSAVFSARTGNRRLVFP